MSVSEAFKFKKKKTHTLFLSLPLANQERPSERATIFSYFSRKDSVLHHVLAGSFGDKGFNKQGIFYCELDRRVR